VAFAPGHGKIVSLPQAITIQWQLGAGHYSSYNNISSSKRYEHSYKRQLYPYPFTSTFDQYKRANITGFSLDISACRSQIQNSRFQPHLAMEFTLTTQHGERKRT